ncbi:DUF2207 domain-containing protein, partial [candidate division GN15 bacterium]|nr:DUF2207 domain-containing protein [candidate division GN15 bacterium]
MVTAPLDSCQSRLRAQCARWLVLLLAVIVVAPSVSAAYFTIEHFHSDIAVHTDASCTVRETILVEFHRERHGIYRDIPFKYRDEFGSSVLRPVTVVSVTDDRGNERPTKVTREGSAVRIRVGDPDRYVRGMQTYVITYRVDNAVLFFDEKDELYWNVTGTYWETSIGRVTAVITPPMGATEASFDYGCYTGGYGSRLSECTWDVTDEGVRFESTASLDDREGMTVALAWDKGVVTEPSAWQQFLWRTNLRENWVFILPILALGFMIFHWHRRGRDPNVREAVAVQYDPPQFKGKSILPAEAGTLIDESLDARDITASVISLAVNGYLRITEKSEKILFFDTTDYELTELKQPDEELSEFERNLMRALFPGGATTVQVSQLKNKFYKSLSGLKKSAFRLLVQKGYFLTDPNKVRGKYVLYALLVGFVLFFVTNAIASYSPLKNVIASIMCAAIVALFAGAMPAKTRRGALALNHIKGFQEFMNRVEKERLERLGEKDIFYRYLPYAIALDVADEWARAFEGIYT